MADELATITGTIYRNTADDADRVPWAGALVRAVPVRLDETSAIADSVSYVPAVTDTDGLVTLHLWPGAWKIYLPDGEVIDGDGAGVVVEAGESYTLLGLRGYVAPPGVTVSTVQLSSLTATTLAAGEDATVEVEGDGLVLGIPRGVQGERGREVELQTTATHVQWRYQGDVAWTDLISLSMITGPAGPRGLSVLFSPSDTYPGLYDLVETSGLDTAFSEDPLHPGLYTIGA